MGSIARWGVALAAFVALASAAAAAPPLDREHLEPFVDGVVREAMASQHLAGVTVAVVNADGPLLLKGYGIAGHGRDVDDDTAFRVGSISKTITWIAIMQLVEEGRLSLDDPINAHLPPDLRIPDDGFAQPILIRHLMTHSAGFEDATLGVIMTQDARRLRTLHDWLIRYRVLRVRPPGQVAVYSNYGAALAGAIVEHESGMAFADYAERNILRPLGMATATYREPYPAALTGRGFPAPLAPDAASRVSSGFRFADGRFVEQSWEFVPMAPAGSLSASAIDMAAYMQALLRPDLFARAHVLRTSTVLAMRGATFRNDPRLGANRHGFWDIPAPTGEFAFGHNGALAFQQANLGIYTRSGIGIFVAMNSANLGPGAPPIIATLPNLILEHFFPVEIAHRVAQAHSESYAGCYRPMRRPHRHTEQGLFAFAVSLCVHALADGDLVVGERRYVPIGDGVYARPDMTDRIAFGERDGRMRFYNYDSSGPSERVGFFEQGLWLQLIAALAALTALARLGGALVRAMAGRETLSALLVDGVSALWLAGLVLFGVASASWLTDFSDALLNYPGTLVPLACWLFLAAAIATAAAAVALAVRFRPQGWIARGGAAATLAIFAVFAVILWQFHLLGFSTW